MWEAVTKARDDLLRKFVEWFFRLLNRLSDKRRGSPSLLKWIVGIIAGALAIFIASLSGWTSQIPEWWEASWVSWPFRQVGASYPQALTTIVGLLTGLLSTLGFQVMIPACFYIPHAYRMRAMGLVQATTEPDGWNRLVRLYLTEHEKGDPPGAVSTSCDPIRVICISGRNLFCTLESPLHVHAREGKLSVLMPATAQGNPTVRARWQSYATDFRDTTYPQIDNLIQEMQISLGFLQMNSKNRVMQHDALCMWRVVLFNTHCVVQNYFPNHFGKDSDKSPVFVFDRSEHSRFSYYETFSQMFDLLSQNGRVPQTVAVSLAPAHLAHGAGAHAGPLSPSNPPETPKPAPPQ